MYTWVYKNQNFNRQEIAELSKKSKIPALIALLLKNRGITDPLIAEKFIKKSLDTIRDPFGLDDMDKAAKRIADAIKNKEKVTIYGDYDVDGVTSTAILVRFLKEHGILAEYYIPDRENEGYGINVMAVNKISKTGTKLLITVDCGITSCGEVELAKTMGMDVIITDHHLCKEKIPQAVAVVNPKRENAGYGFRELAGAGVALKLILAVTKELGEKTSDCFFEYVELAAVGTISDVVSLLDENRVIAQKGIISLQNPKNIGLKALIEVAGAAERGINATTVAFMIAPRINAGGRLGSAKTAIELLLCDDYDKALELAEELNSVNSERRIFEQEIYEEALEIIDNDPEFDKKKVIVLAKKGWHNGVIGIVSSRITEKFYKPSIILSIDEDGKAKGSGRSIDGFHLFDALNECSDTLINFGGHAMAAGLGLSSDNIEDFSRCINQYANKVISEDMLYPKIEIDCEISPNAVTCESVKMIEHLEPFGMDNPRPVFSISKARVREIKKIGSDATHMRLVIEKDGVILNGVGFRMADYADKKAVGDFVDVAFTMDINTFNNQERVQLILKDIR